MQSRPLGTDLINGDMKKSNTNFPRLLRMIQGDTKKREILKPPTKIEEIQEKKFTDRN